MNKTILLSIGLAFAVASYCRGGDYPSPTAEMDALQAKAEEVNSRGRKILAEHKIDLEKAGVLSLAPKDVPLLAPKIIPFLRQELAIWDQWDSLWKPLCADFYRKAKREPPAGIGGSILRTKSGLLLFMGMLGDEESRTRLEKMTQSNDETEVFWGVMSVLNFHWWQAANDQQQAKVIDELDAFLQKHPKNDSLLELVPTFFYGQPLKVSKMAQQRMAKLCETPRVKNYLRAAEARSKAYMEAEGRFALKHVGKPLLLTGKTLHGGEFTTAAWKGKVILVDFWATWCGPCIQEFPQIKELYRKYRESGLEVVGISGDEQADTLTHFLANRPDLPWPQLLESTGKPEPLFQQCNVKSVPRIFIIDRRGLLRSIHGRQEMEEVIPKLLKEK
jgi:thiol-disulfide isomerase/thioredoxin